jgi:hypothetical protein
VFGSVRLARMGYGQRGVVSLYPRDAELNVPWELYSHGVRRQVAEEAARGSFDEAVKAIDRTTGAEVAKRQVEQLAARAATDFDAFYDSRAAASPEQAVKTAPILVLTTDGKGVVMRPEALREATRKAAGKRQRKLRKRAWPRAKRRRRAGWRRWRPFTPSPRCTGRPRTSCDLDGNSRDALPDAVARPRPENKRVWARVEKAPARGHRGDVRRGRSGATRSTTRRGWSWSTATRPNST